MVGRARWLALEVTDLDRVRPFYESTLDLAIRAERDREVVLGAGDAELRLREPRDVPRGGVHTHYALSIPDGEYEAWRDRLAGTGREVAERRFGDVRSLYCFDPAGHCVELATAADASDGGGGSGGDGGSGGSGGSGSGSDGSDGSGDGSDGVAGIFEVVLEVEDLDDALVFYRTLGFEVIDRGDDRRARLTAGGVDLELWEPRLGIAGGQGGVHVDWGVAADDPSRAGRRVATDALAVESVESGIRVRDPDGHYLTLC